MTPQEILDKTLAHIREQAHTPLKLEGELKHVLYAYIAPNGTEHRAESRVRLDEYKRLVENKPGVAPPWPRTDETALLNMLRVVSNAEITPGTLADWENFLRASVALFPGLTYTPPQDSPCNA